MTREKAIELIGAMKGDLYDFYDYDDLEALEMAISALSENKCKTGHWIAADEEPHEDYECDKCGYVISTYTANIEPHTEYKYCPNCGARMKGGE